MVTIAQNPFYQLRIEEGENRLYMNVRGAWLQQKETAHYLAHVKEALAALKPGFSIYCDIRELGECAPAVQQVFLKVQLMVVQAGVGHIVEVHTLNSPGSEMAIDLARQSKIPLNIFDSPDDALAWLIDQQTRTL